MVGASLRHFCLSILFAICCHSQSIGTLESFNWTCALPVEESTPLNDTVAGQWMIHSLFDAIESAAADSNALSEKVCSNRSGVDKLICKRIVVDALENMVSGSCSDFSLDNISEICQSTPPGRFCMIENDPDNTSQSCVMRDSNGVGISLDCPPGFYCLGTIYQPRACPKGSFCPNNASRPLSCPEGMFCPVAAINVSCGEDSSYVKSSSILKGSMCMPDKDNRTILPEPCPKGNYCQHGKNYSCGEGDYCPLGAAVGQHCDFLEECPHGSSKPGRLWKVLLVSSVLLAIAFLMVYKVDLWCMTRDRRWLRILFALIALSSIWVAEHQMQDPTYAPVFMLTGFFSCLLWGMIVVPQVSKRVTSGLARKTIDGVFFVSVALLAWIGCEDVYTGVFVAVFIPCGWCFWVALVDEHSDGPSKSTYCGMDGADRKKFLVMFFVCSLGVILLAACCNVDLAFVYLSFSLLICFDITFRILYQKLESCCKREIQRPPDDPGQSLMENGEVMHRRSTETNGTRNSEDSILHLSSTSFQAATEDQHKRVGISIRFRHVTLEVPTKKAGDWKKIMNNITLSIPAGESVAIMGPSGCGKSTLVKVLSGRANYGKISGKIIINEQDGLQIQEIQNLVGFVPQDDVMHRNLTVREIVKFQASLRMPNSDGATREHRVETLVQSLLDILGLNRGDVPDTPIGGEENEPGVSGGQRKRVSIAMELAAEPKLLLLDEPTSGLDSTTSESVIRQIVDYSRNNRCTSLAVIHQPRYSMLNMFDRVIFLSVGGFLVYSGRTGDWCKQYFVGTLGVSIPTEANPADIFLDEITPREGEDVEEKGKGFAQKWSRYLKSSLNEFEPLERMLVDVPASGEKCTWGDEIFLQMQRAMLQMRKSWAQVLANNVMLVLGLICLCVGAPPKQPFDDFVHTSLALFLLMLTQGVAAQRIFGGPEKVVGWREYGASINLALYFVGRDITAFLEMFFGTVLFCMIYWPFGPLLISLRSMMWVSFSFVFAVWGLNYIWSVLLFGGGAQMMAVVCSFVSFLFAGVQPQFVPLSQMVHSQGIYIMAVSPIRWAHGSFMSGHILGAETAFSNELVQYMVKGNLFALGYPLNWITENNWTFAENYVPVKDLWEGQMRTDDFHEDELSEKSFIRPPIAFVNKPKQLLLLGLFFRFVGFVFLLATAKRNYSGGGPFLQSQNKLVAHFNRNVFRLLCVIFTNCMMAILIRTI